MPAKSTKKSASSDNQPLQSVKGMHDILPVDQPAFEKIQKNLKEVAEFYNFQPITTPIVEPLALYVRTTGETSDIVEKQMFTIRTKSGEPLALRPEFTPGIARAFIQHGLSHLGSPLKLFTFGPLFRYEQPQAGRLRQFHQANFEILSVENDPIYDVQIILACYRLLTDLKIKNLRIEINTIGCRTCRPNYRKQLQTYYKSKEKNLCADCKRRLPLNPLRLLDCKNPNCLPLKEGAPIILDYLCSYCKNHFKGVLEYVEDSKLPYSLNHHLVRGLDYYTKTVFEFFTETAPGEEAIDFALGGGGRYDYLVEMLGGKPTAAVGAALGAERILEVMKRRNLYHLSRVKAKVFLIHIGDLAKKKSLSLIEELQKENISVTESLGKESLVAQLRAADKLEAPIAMIFGQKEAYEDSIILRDMKTGAQETVPLNKVGAVLKKRL